METSLLMPAVNGLVYASILFLVSFGFTLMYGLMRLANFAHGAVYLLGGYVGLELSTGSNGSFLVSLVVGSLIGALVGGVVFALIRPFEGKLLPQILLTLGIMAVIREVVVQWKGGTPRLVTTPSALSGSVELFGQDYPLYRLGVLALGILVAVVILVVEARTTVGARVRAMAEDPETLGAMGVNTTLVSCGVVLLSSGTAGFAGVVGGAYRPIGAGVELDILLLAVVVVILGGLGSTSGAVIASVVIGLIDAFGRTYLPELAFAGIFLPMMLVLLFRPTGIMGKSVVAR